jgi:hypothetical protein
MEINTSDNSERRDPSEKVAIVGTYLQKNNSQSDKICNYMEFIGKEKRGRKEITLQ